MIELAAPRPRPRTSCLGLVLVLACGPSSAGGSGTDSGGTATDATTAGTAEDTGDDGNPGDTGDTGDGTGGSSCAPGNARSVFTVMLGDWPSEPGFEPSDADYTIDATCAVQTIAGNGGGFTLVLDCTDPNDIARTITLDTDLVPVADSLPVAAMDEVRFRFIRDTWRDVTQAGQGDWVAVSASEGSLVFAAMDGRAEFLSFVPNPDGHDDWYDPLVLSYGESCGAERRQLGVDLSDAHVTVADGTWDTLTSADGSYAVIVDEMRSESQGPENPSVSTFSLALVQNG